MKTNQNISSIDISLLRKFVTDTLSSEESKQLSAFLVANPEYKEVLEGLTLEDIEKIAAVSKASVAKVQQVSGQKWKGYGWAAAMVGVLIAGSIWYQNGSTSANNTQVAESSDDTSAQQDLIALDTSSNEPMIEDVAYVADTFYYVNTDESVPEVTVEYVIDNQEDQELAFKNPVEVPVIETDSTPEKEEIHEEKVAPIIEEEIAFTFNASLDYRQSVAVESNYAAAYKVGQTKSFAGPIGGYEYSPEGMPYFGDKEEDFYTFLEQELSADTLLTKIHKTMEARVSFEVDHKGNIEKVSVVKCNHKQLCMKLAEIFENVPKWEPSEHKGKKGSAHYVIQVIYE